MNSHRQLLYSSIFRRRIAAAAGPRTIVSPSAALLFVTRGEGMLRLQRKATALKAGHVCFLAAGTQASCRAETPAMELCVLWLREVAIERRAGRLRIRHAGEDQPLFRTGRLFGEAALPLVQQAMRLYEDDRAGALSAEARQLRAAGLCLALLERAKQAEAEQLSVRDMELSVQYMHEHYRRPIRLRQLADLSGMTPTSYARRFKQVKGVAPIEYLTRIRVEAAKRLLAGQAGPASVADAAEHAGFGGARHLSRVFKAATGLTPACYINRSRLAVAVVSCLGYERNIRSLGVAPVAALNLYDPAGDGTEHALAAPLAERQLEELARARPDLIIADYRHEAFVSSLKAVAPVVMSSRDADWRSAHRQLAEWTGREARARTQLSQLDGKIERTRKLLRQSIGSQSVSLLRMINRVFRLQGMTDHPLNELLYAELALQPGSEVPHARISEYPPGLFPPLETDFLLLYKHRSFADADDALRRVSRDSEWAQMSAVKREQVHSIANWVVLSWSPEGQRRILDDMLAMSARR